MNRIILCYALISLLVMISSEQETDYYDEYDTYEDEKRAFIELQRRGLPFNKCITDHECKGNQYCDHTGINPIGSCKEGKGNGHSCMFDRHCSSKACHLLKCVPRKPVKDGPCNKDHHEECIETQYCSHKENIYKCRDRSCSGLCAKDAHCLSNKCSVIKCKKPEKGC